MKKRAVLTFLVGVMVLVSVFMPSLQANEVKVEIDGVQVQFDVQPFIKDGRTLVPLRAIAEMLGIEVEWDGEARSVSYINHDGVLYILVIDQPYVSFGTHADAMQATEIDVPPIIVDGRTFVPLRFIAESLGVDVDFVDGVVFLTTAQNEVSVTVEPIDSTLPTPQPTPTPTPTAVAAQENSWNASFSDRVVWTANRTSEVIHRTDTCSSMANPIQTTIADALARPGGGRPCRVCWTD